MAGGVAEQAALAKGLLLDEQTMLVMLSFSRFGNQRHLAEEDYEVGGDVDKAVTSAAKVRLESAALRDIERYDTETRRWLRRRSLPSFVAPGTVRLPLALLDEAVQWLTDREAGRAELVEVFRAEWPQAVERTRAKLGHLFDPADYPGVAVDASGALVFAPDSADQAAAAFRVRWRFVASGVPSLLAKVSAAAYEAERAKYAAHLEAAAAKYVELLRVQFAELVRHLADRLAPKPDGTKRVLRASSLEKIAEFLALFPALNVADDAELAKVVAQVDALLSGVEAEALRDDDALREAMSATFAEIAQGLDALVVEAKAGARKVRLDD